MTLAVRLLQDRSDAEEAVQDAFVQAFRSLEQFRGDSAFSTWFYRILYNRCMSRRRRRRGAPDTIAFADGEDGDWPDDSPAVDDEVGRSDFQDFVAGELERLPEHFRTALTLFYVQEMKYEEIAATMQVPLGSVKTYLFRGKQQLRRRLQKRLQAEVRTV